MSTEDRTIEAVAAEDEWWWWKQDKVGGRGKWGLGGIRSLTSTGFGRRMWEGRVCEVHIGSADNRVGRAPLCYICERSALFPPLIQITLTLVSCSGADGR